VVGFDRADPRAANPALLEYCRGEISDAGQVTEVVRRVKPDLVYHLAGLAGGADGELYRVNFLGTVHLLEAVRQHAPEARVLLVGSAAEYGLVPASDMPIRETHPAHPVGTYGASKYAATLAGLDSVRRHNLKVVVARPFNIVGAGIPDSLVIGAILARARKALESAGPARVAVGRLDTERDFVAVEDVVEAYWRMLQAPCWGEVFNICSGQPLTVGAMLDSLFRCSERPVSLEVDPTLVRPSDVPVVYGSCEKARRRLGFEPRTPLDAALRRAWEHAMRSAD
jgi:GDP-4-dehydro-6-deoxy-D-mannose reductase